MAEDNSAGFTVKEMLVRVEAKMDVVLADHEHRLRVLEANEADREGAANKSEKIGAKAMAWFAVAISFIGAGSNIIAHYL